ncbi:hypothetical protein RHGRI_025546 [Rhododendron griersonianum]|uniref:Uncharacterized protein n=1 Tax=Rhododendron griersonianum TaxID=479676 RepID=A0AAV6IQ30_9ERIC|nr:hypothetical protein RHGRI_025546 [Rhododendron griersonianum]
MASSQQTSGGSHRIAAVGVQKETPTNDTLEGFDIENQKKQVRKLELLVAFMVFTMAACFFGEMSYVKPPADDLLKGMFIPKLKGRTATADAIALLGALIMPHNLFLHSALVLSRKIPNSVRGIKDACRYFLIESGFALLVAFFINVAVISVTATICSAEDLSEQCNNITLNSASFLLKIIVISWILGLGIIGINIYYLSTAFVGWMIHNNLPKVATVFIAILVFPLMVVYIASVIYLMFRKDGVATFIDTTKNDPAVLAPMEDSDLVPYREDLADIPLPE